MRQEEFSPHPCTPLDNLTPQSHGELLCYPKFTLEEFQSRVEELRALSIQALEEYGCVPLTGHSTLGKGYVSVVVAALWRNNQRCALKIRRLDSGRPDMRHEADMIAKANEASVGPLLYAVSRDFLALELIDGMFLPEWVGNLKGRGRRNVLKSTLKNLLEQCKRLDDLSLDHGELSRASRHVIIAASNMQPHIIDFETASIHRRPSNVTSLCQYLFLGSQCARHVGRILGGVDRQTVIETLRTYKTSKTDRNFDAVLATCRLM
ncbi:MAG: serine/threonine protein kinase [Candidatus Bathyarchaeia archaeon]